jgi:hypothetical protein
MDNLEQFGALVTNGQEEIASLAYLVVLETIEANRRFIISSGDYYQERLRDLAARNPRIVETVDGVRHMASLFFHTPELAEAFAAGMNGRCIDVSTHSYKAESLPAALTKLPLVADRSCIDFVIGAMEDVFESMSG